MRRERAHVAHHFMTMLLVLSLAAASFSACSAHAAEPTVGKWIDIFNGKDLDGWTPKITGHALDENYADTFQVRDGLLTVSYDKYEKFDNKFGHLFYQHAFSHYRIRLQYRFIGEQTLGGPGWAFRNSGIMVHCQDPATMTKDQNFPVSIEVQLLGGDGSNKRTTGNLCTPGTHVVRNGKLDTTHCINSTSDTFHGDQWVTAEVEVRGSEIIRHIINGKVVLEYTSPQLDPGDGDAKRLLDNGAGTMLSKGWISLQAESHPVQFRNIQIMLLE
ncbi:MAG TPA: DUF1080 domain-containing protein [Anaerohalosphaeraceae bacterium]|jgi:hypothetical protein|nr:DUF1080 domain-containing protein [Anaerohalosphaeraceae bacterium]HRT51034.1 DUF1080 domain-containing protein [Anaerohalosphaeraceae bacterium]HRT87020.1 DUF1080 domain-containing protein [Anaerohalosphaeraceae bacterium]